MTELRFGVVRSGRAATRENASSAASRDFHFHSTQKALHHGAECGEGNGDPGSKQSRKRAYIVTARENTTGEFSLKAKSRMHDTIGDQGMQRGG